MWDKTAVIQPPNPITYSCFLPPTSSVPSLFPCSLRGVTDTCWQLLTLVPLLAQHPPYFFSPPWCLPLIISLFPLIYPQSCFLHLPLLVLLQPVSFISPFLLRPVLSSDIKAIWWMRLSQTVHRNKVLCCLPCTMRNQLIDVYWHTVYQIELLYHRQ